MSVGHLLLRLRFELEILLELRLGGLLLIGETPQDLGRTLGLYKNQIGGFRSRYTHSFNIIGGR